MDRFCAYQKFCPISLEPDLGIFDILKFYGLFRLKITFGSHEIVSGLASHEMFRAILSYSVSFFIRRV